MDQRPTPTKPDMAWGLEGGLSEVSPLFPLEQPARIAVAYANAVVGWHVEDLLRCVFRPSGCIDQPPLSAEIDLGSPWVVRDDVARRDTC